MLSHSIFARQTHLTSFSFHFDFHLSRDSPNRIFPIWKYAKKKTPTSELRRGIIGLNKKRDKFKPEWLFVFDASPNGSLPNKVFQFPKRRKKKKLIESQRHINFLRAYKQATSSKNIMFFSTALIYLYQHHIHKFRWRNLSCSLAVNLYFRRSEFELGSKLIMLSMLHHFCLLGEIDAQLICLEMQRLRIICCMFWQLKLIQHVPFTSLTRQIFHSQRLDRQAEEISRHKHTHVIKNSLQKLNISRHQHQHRLIARQASKLSLQDGMKQMTFGVATPTCPKKKIVI